MTVNRGWMQKSLKREIVNDLQTMSDCLWSSKISKTKFYPKYTFIRENLFLYDKADALEDISPWIDFRNSLFSSGSTFNFQRPLPSSTSSHLSSITIIILFPPLTGHFLKFCTCKESMIIQKIKKTLTPVFGTSWKKSQPYWFLSFFCAPRQDIALFKCVKIFFPLCLIIFLKIDCVGIVYM